MSAQQTETTFVQYLRTVAAAMPETPAFHFGYLADLNTGNLNRGDGSEKSYPIILVVPPDSSFADLKKVWESFTLSIFVFDKKPKKEPGYKEIEEHWTLLKQIGRDFIVSAFSLDTALSQGIRSSLKDIPVFLGNDYGADKLIGVRYDVPVALNKGCPSIVGELGCLPVEITLLADGSVVEVESGGAYTCDNRPVTITDTDTMVYEVPPGSAFACTVPVSTAPLTMDFGATDSNQAVLLAHGPIEITSVDLMTNLSAITFTKNGSIAPLPISLVRGDKLAAYGVRITPGQAAQAQATMMNTAAGFSIASRPYEELEAGVFYDESENGRRYGYMPGLLEQDIFPTKITYDPGVTFSTAYLYAWYSRNQIVGNVVGRIRTVISGSSHAFGLRSGAPVDPVNSYATWSNAMDYQMEILNQRAVRVYQGGVLLASINLTNAINNQIAIAYNGANIVFEYVPASDPDEVPVVLYTSASLPSGNYWVSFLPQDRTPSSIYAAVRAEGGWKQ